MTSSFMCSSSWPAILAVVEAVGGPRPGRIGIGDDRNLALSRSGQALRRLTGAEDQLRVWCDSEGSSRFSRLDQPKCRRALAPLVTEGRALRRVYRPSRKTSNYT